MAKAGIPEAEREEALQTLERVGYVDDARVAATRAEVLAGRGQGDQAIRYDLAGRGIGPGAIDEALAGLEPESERAIRLVERFGATAKTAAQLRRKGFSEDSLAGALRQVASEL